MLRFEDAEEAKKQFCFDKDELDELLGTFFPFMESDEACDSYNELMSIIEDLVSEKNASQYLHEINTFMCDAKIFVALSQGMTVLNEKQEPLSRDQAKDNLFNSANQLGQKISPTWGDKLLGALQMFVGIVLSILSLCRPCTLSILNNGHRLFNGYRSKAVATFKDSLIAAEEALKPQEQRMG